MMRSKAFWICLVILALEIAVGQLYVADPTAQTTRRFTLISTDVLGDNLWMQVLHDRATDTCYVAYLTATYNGRSVSSLGKVPCPWQLPAEGRR